MKSIGFLLVLEILVMSISTHAQPSYQIAVDGPNFLLRGGLLTSDSGGVMGLFFGNATFGNAQDLVLVDFSQGGGGLKNAWKIQAVGSPTGVSFAPFSLGKTFFKGSKMYFSVVVRQGVVSSSALLKVDLDSQGLGVRAYPRNSVLAFDDATQDLLIASPFDSLCMLSKVNADLDTLWRRFIRVSIPGFDGDSINDLSVQYHPQFGYFLSGSLLQAPLRESFLLRMAFDGTPLSGRSYGPIHFRELHLVEDGIILVGSVDTTLTQASTEKNLLLAKFNFDLTPAWSKLFFAENFEFFQTTLSLLSDGTMAMGYSTTGYFPVILARLDSEGQILWQKGYPLFTPVLRAMPDGSLLQLSTNFSVNPPQTILAKTDPQGDIAGCEVFPTCLHSLPFDMDGTPLLFEEVSATYNPGANFDLALDTLRLPFSDHCDNPLPPSPEFSVPDTVCVFDSIATLAENNANAHGTLWRLKGNGLDSVWTDSLNFRFRFHQPGTYVLSQRVWFLGCATLFEDTIHVLPSLQPQIFTSDDLCEPPAELSLEVNRGVTEIYWSNGDTFYETLATQDGFYSVSVSDGYCSSTDTFSVSFVSTTLGGNPPFTLPDDTTVCLQELPFQLLPQSGFTDSFQLNNQSMPVPFSLKSEGTYLVTALVENCPFEASFQLETTDCSPAIFFPNVFSPNGDGINDRFFPQGKNFLPSRLLIFDRWGGMVYASEGMEPSWDGGDQSPGTYVFFFEYLDERSGEIGIITGDVLLIR